MAEEVESAGRESGSLSVLIRESGLNPKQVEYLRSRWLKTVRHMQDRAGKNRLWLYLFRGVSVVGSVLVPALIGVGLEVVATVVSVIVAATVGLTELMRFGPRWRLHRAYGSHLEQEGWRYLERSGTYASFETPMSGFESFVEAVEKTIAEFEQEYVRDVVVSGPTTPEPGKEHPSTRS